MAALDDALHGNLGKAGEDRIFEMEHTYDPLPVILTGKKSLSISSYYMDVDENILATEEDAFMVANYDYCRNIFLFSQKPLFLRLAREIRNRFLKESGVCKQE